MQDCKDGSGLQFMKFDSVTGTLALEVRSLNIKSKINRTTVRTSRKKDLNCHPRRISRVFLILVFLR